jgi:hypothetical protein
VAAETLGSRVDTIALHHSRPRRAERCAKAVGLPFYQAFVSKDSRTRIALVR